MLKGGEERIVKAMEEGFSGINLTVVTKLEAMNWTMDKREKNQRVLKKKAKKIEDRLTSIESKGNEDEENRQWNDFDYGRDHGKDREMAEAEKDKEKAETWKKNSEKGEEDEENSGKDEEDEENSEKGEEEEEQEPEKDKENSDSVEKGEENVEESDEEDSLLRLQERVRVQAEEFWRTIDDESGAEKEAEKEAEEEGEKEGEKEVQEEKEAEKEESKGTPTSTGVIIITPHGRTKAAAARKAIQTEIAELAEKEAEVEAIQTEQEAIQTEIAELAEKEAEVEAIQTEQEAIQTAIVEKEAEVTEKDAEVAEKEDQDVDEEEEKAEESDKNPNVDQDMEEEEEKAEESEDNPVESPSEKQTELAEKSVEVEVKTKRKPRVNVIAVPYGIPRAERLAKMRAEAEKKKAKAERLAKMRAEAEKKKVKADGAPKKKGRPKKTDVTLKPCTPLPEKRKGEPSRWMQSPFTEGKTDELEVPKKKLKTKT
ncbi:glutamic acid-rich protein-like [Brassica napus]|nr:glutamic acid-rich protein-like [Brassica napus]